jgi:TRAP-type C4-dicarboxylate transport system permease small subunit
VKAAAPVHAPLVLQRDRHLKWVALDPLERVLMVSCGVLLGGFVLTVFLDVVTRTIGHPWLWLQEVTSVQFIYCTFLGAAVAVRRDDHLLLTAITGAMTGRLRFFFEIMNRVVILVVAICMVRFGIQNVQLNLASFRMPSLTPLAYWVAAIPLSGALIVLFEIEQIFNGWRNGFEHHEPVPSEPAVQRELAEAVET